MKIYKTKIERHKYQALIKRTCDLCGQESEQLNEENWDARGYDINETRITVKITQKEGSAYPEGGSGTKYDIDLCPDCFKDRLIPWLISQGAKIKQEEWDF